jgi:hypothetical protein
MAAALRHISHDRTLAYPDPHTAPKIPSDAVETSHLDLCTPCPLRGKDERNVPGNAFFDNKLDMNELCRNTDGGLLCIPLHPGAKTFYQEQVLA